MTGRGSPRRLPLVAGLAAAVAAAQVMRIVADHTIDVVRDRQLLPRWDLATHLGHGWRDFDFLATGQVHRFVWDLWLQGYWPPGLSLYQVPFYLVLGGDMTSGLWSSAAAFTLAAAVAAALLVRQWGSAGLLPAALFVALMVTSPFILAYASVTMTEMLGVLGQLLVVLAYAGYQHRPTPAAARLFAISLTVLFFVKYNYLVLLAGPLVIHEWLAWTAGASAARRLDGLRSTLLRLVVTPAGAVLTLFALFVAAITFTGGFEFTLAGQRISVRTVGSSGHVVLYGLLVYLWHLHRRRRIDWHRLMALDPRIRPLLLWFAVPVTIWLASPYPNHLRDVANLVINRPLGEPSVKAGLAAYGESLRTAYFYAPWVLACVLLTFAIATTAYRRQPAWVQWLILAIPMQAAAIALHQTRFPRFLLLTVVLLCLVAASEVGRWLSRSWRGRLAGAMSAPIVAVAGVLAAPGVAAEPRFRAAAFEHYTDSPTLSAALAEIRRELNGLDRLVIVGQSNDLAPAMFRWELGPPSGAPCFPFEAVGASRLDPGLATRVLLLEPIDPAQSSLDAAPHHAARRRETLEAVERGELRLHREFLVADLNVTLRLYLRPTALPQPAPCR